MRLASVRGGGAGGEWRLGVVGDDLGVALPDPELGTVDDIVRGGEDALARVASALDGAPRVSLDEVELGPPLRRFNRDVLCTGWNYWDHYEELRGKRGGQDPAERPTRPTFFTKGPAAVVGPRGPIAIDPDLSERFDYEAELALVIGRTGRSIPESDALGHVFGYCVANDVSVRDLQRAHGGQWLKGKSIDATMPLGPWITTADAVADLGGLRITCEVGGEIVQDARLGQMAFPVARLIAELSWGMTLEAGDLLLTGTPSGVGNAREPQRFLAPGDRVVTRIEGLGELDNRVERVDLAAPAVGPA